MKEGIAILMLAFAVVAVVAIEKQEDVKRRKRSAWLEKQARREREILKRK